MTLKNLTIMLISGMTITAFISFKSFTGGKEWAKVVINNAICTMVVKLYKETPKNRL